MSRVRLTLMAALMVLTVTVHATDRAVHVEGRVPEAIRASQGFHPAESTGLFVGIRNFDDPEFIEVPFAVDDAVDLAHLFALELDLIAPQNVILALSGDPQKPRSADALQALLQAGAQRVAAQKSWILRHLQRQGNATGQRGVFVVAFATHGFSDQGRDFLVARDTVRGFIQDTGIKVDIMFDQAAQATAPRRLVLLDACRERLSKARVSGRPDPESAMGQAFATAIANASGQVVLSGTTPGGYSYDDAQLQNGVFTASVIDGLRGKAPANAQHLITARTLADYVDERVRRWVRTNRPQHAQLSTGISQKFEGPAASMPLAVDPAGMQAAVANAQRERQDAALKKLYANVDFRGPITGRLADEVAHVLHSELDAERREALLIELEALDGSQRSKRIFADYFQQRREQFGLVGETSQQPVEVSSPPPPEPTTYTLTVQATPADSRIRIMNIRPVYEPGMALAPGHYHIQVEREGYHTARQWVTIQDRDIVVDMTLEQIAMKRESETTTPTMPSKTWRNTLGMEFVLIPAGRFQMGTPEHEVDAIVRRANLKKQESVEKYRAWVEREVPQHDMTISQPFYLGKYEVTQAQWEAVMGHNPSAYKGSDRPVENVSWEEVQDFIRNLNKREPGVTYRLPTEAEGEYAARGSNGRMYPWGDQFDSTRLNFCDQNCSQDWKDQSANDGYATTSPVGRYESGRSPLGVYDMAGNVWEWVQDWYGEYPSSPQRDPTGPPSGTDRVFRGGSWGHGARRCRSAYRGVGHPGSRSGLLGFRLLRAVP